MADDKFIGQSRTILDTKSSYESDLEMLNQQDKSFRPRTNFETSFFFEEVQLTR